MLTQADLYSLRNAGYIFYPEFDNVKSTLEIGNEIGTVLNLNSIDSAYPNRSVDILRPREKCGLSLNRYHGNFGFQEYPAHTDFAHWLTPPRFLLLRGRGGAEHVRTHIYHAQTLADMLPEAIIKRALFFARKARIKTALSMRIARTEKLTLRWDPLFICPANSHARLCAEIVSSDEFKNKRLEFNLGNNMILIIDNWRTLHGRSSVPSSDQLRKVDRIYLEKIYGISS